MKLGKDMKSKEDRRKLRALRYINRKRYGRLRRLRRRIGDDLMEEFLLLGFIHRGYTLTEETWGINHLGEEYYERVK